MMKQKKRKQTKRLIGRENSEMGLEWLNNNNIKKGSVNHAQLNGAVLQAMKPKQINKLFVLYFY